VYLNNEPLAVREYQKSPGLYFFLNDHLGTPQKLINSAGAVVWSAAYLPYGEAQVQANSTITNNLRFPGQYYDEETDLHFNWNRYYDPVLGRYLSPDPIGIEGGMNMYGYVGGDPVNWADRFGLAPGDRFLSPDAAAIDALDYYMPQSAKTGREYGGYIYKRQDRDFSYAHAVTGNSDKMNTNDFNCTPDGNIEVAIYHTHPGSGRLSAYFSTLDYIVSGNKRISIYLGTETGLIKKWTPNSLPDSGTKILRYE